MKLEFKSKIYVTIGLIVMVCFIILFFMQRVIAPEVLPVVINNNYYDFLNEDRGYTVQVGEVKIRVEVAKSEGAKTIGLSGRVTLDKDAGMLFIYPEPQRLKFWMEGMKFPLDIIWLDNSKVVSLTQSLPAPNEGKDPAETSSGMLANMALEVNAGFIAEHGVKIGDDYKLLTNGR